MIEASIILIALCVLGAITGVVKSWLESGEPFDNRRFAYLILIIEALIAGIVASLTFVGITAVFPWTYLLAFLAGLGIDVTGYLSVKVAKYTLGL